MLTASMKFVPSAVRNHMAKGDYETKYYVCANMNYHLGCYDSEFRKLVLPTSYMVTCSLLIFHT